MPTHKTNSAILVNTAVVTSEKNKSHAKWFAGINSIRFILALIVFLSHCPDPFVKYMGESKYLIVRDAGAVLGISFLGIAAVMAFFIISGFVIHYPNKDGIANIQQFYIRRGMRVLLPLLVITIAGIPFGSPEKVIVWSLYCELIYYAIYPVLACIKKISWDTKIKIAFAIAIIIVCLYGDDVRSLIWHKNINYNGDFIQFGIGLNWLVGLPIWLLGVALAEKINDLNKPVARAKIWFYRIFIFVLSVIFSGMRFHFFVSCSVSMLIMAFPILKWIELEICYYKLNKTVSWLEKCGRFSYSLYLCHPLVVALLLTITPLNNYSYFFYIATVILMSYVFYLVLEKPAHLLAKKISAQKMVEQF